jgi:HD-like signal output (HDOD) protein
VLIILQPSSDIPDLERRFFEVIRGLPAFPTVMLKLLRLLAREQVTIKELSVLIRTDASLTTQLLRLANSPLFGFGREITSILQAVSLLGLDRVRTLALTVAMHNYLAGVGKGPLLRRCWRHNLATALVGEKLASACWLDKEAVYLAGLLHEAGRLFLVAGSPEVYRKMLESAADPAFDLEAAEREEFGGDHHEVTLWLAAEWGIPPALQSVIRRSGQPLTTDALDEAGAVQVGHRLAGLIGFAFEPPPPTAESWNEIVAELSPWEYDQFGTREADLRVEIASRINSIEMSVG